MIPLSQKDVYKKPVSTAALSSCYSVKKDSAIRPVTWILEFGARRIVIAMIEEKGGTSVEPITGARN